MSTRIHDELRRITDTARTRRAHLSSRALLAMLIRLSDSLRDVASDVRGALDPAGGAEAEGRST